MSMLCGIVLFFALCRCSSTRSPSRTRMNVPGTWPPNVHTGYFTLSAISATVSTVSRFTMTRVGCVRVIGGGTFGAWVTTAISWPVTSSLAERIGTARDTPASAASAFPVQPVSDTLNSSARMASRTMVPNRDAEVEGASVRGWTVMSKFLWRGERRFSFLQGENRLFRPGRPSGGATNFPGEIKKVDVGSIDYTLGNDLRGKAPDAWRGPGNPVIRTPYPVCQRPVRAASRRRRTPSSFRQYRLTLH